MRSLLSSAASWRSIRTGALVAVMSLASATVAAAQAVPNRESALEIRKRYLMDLDTVHTKILALAEAIPAEKYAWRPAPGVRSIGEAFMHVASEYYVYAPMGYGPDLLAPARRASILQGVLGTLTLGCGVLIGEE